MLYVADSGNRRIQVFWLGQLNGTTILGGGSTVNLKLSKPTTIALDVDGCLFVVDNGNDRIIASTKTMSVTMTTIGVRLSFSHSTCGISIHILALIEPNLISTYTSMITTAMTRKLTSNSCYFVIWSVLSLFVSPKQ